MPYNVICTLHARSVISHCSDAGEALRVLRQRADEGGEGFRVVSSEGVVVSPDRLEIIARLDRSCDGVRSPIRVPQPSGKPN